MEGLEQKQLSHREKDKCVHSHYMSLPWRFLICYLWVE